MYRLIVNILLVMCVSLSACRTVKEPDKVWQQYREVALPGASMEQIHAGIEAWDATSYDIAIRVDTADYENGYMNLEGVCSFEYNPKGYWCQGLPNGMVCHALVTMTVRDEWLKVWFTRFSFGDTADGLFNECNGLSYNSGPICVDLPHSLKGTDRFGAKLLYKHVKPHMLKWVDSTMQEFADHIAAQQANDGL